MNKLPIANKELGQHFLKDQKVINLISHDHADNVDSILEIGPGPGILTKYLSQHQQPLHVIEKDSRFPELLKEFVASDNIHLLDATECDYQNFIDENFPHSHKLWLVSNLPYNVGSVIFVKALQTVSITHMTLMFQREVADKAFAIDTRKGKAMNSLLALSQTYCDISLLCKVPPGAFSPPPKVESAVLSLMRKPDPVIPLSDFKGFEKFLRALFKFKRKQMGKVLTMSYPKGIIEQALSEASLEKSLRAESLELAQVQTLYQVLKRTKDEKNGH